MILKLRRKDLSDAVGIASKFSSPRSPVAHMQNVRLEVKKGTMTAQASNAHGSCWFPVPCDGEDTELIVSCATLHKTAGLLSGEEVSLKVLKNKVKLQGDGPAVEIPLFTQWSEPHIGDLQEGFSVEISDLDRCLAVAESVKSDTEMKYANGIRIVTDGSGTLHLSSSTSKNASFSWCPCVSDGPVDIVSSRGAISAVRSIMKFMPDLTVIKSNGRVVFRCSNGPTAIINQESGGAPPVTLSVLKKTWENPHEWRVDREKLLEFLRHTLAIASPEASGIWMEPREDGLDCRYTGLSDGTNSVDLSVDATCEFHVPGEACEGMPAYLSSRVLAPAVMAVGNDGFMLKSADKRAILVECDSAVVAVAQMHPPSKVRA